MNRSNNEYFSVVPPIYEFMSQIYEDKNNHRHRQTKSCTDQRQTTQADAHKYPQTLNNQYQLIENLDMYCPNIAKSVMSCLPVIRL